MTFSICHTSARPQAWRAVYDAWLANAVDASEVEYLLVCDRRWGFDELPTLRPQDKAMWNDQRRCYVDGVNIAAAAATGDILIVNADDQFPCADWDFRLLEAVADKGADEPLSEADFVIEVSTDTPAEHEKQILVMPILSRGRYDRFGWVFFSQYSSMWADNDFCAMAKRDGVVIDARHLVFPHKHYLNGQREIDAQDQAHGNLEVYNRGEALFNARKAINFSGVPSTAQAPSAPLDDKRPLIAFATPGNLFGGAWLDAWTNLWTYMASNVNYNITHLRTYTSSAPIVRTVMSRAILTTDYGVPVDFVMWIDDDNTITPEQFEMLMQDLREHPEYDAVVGWTWCGHDDDPEVGYATMSCGALINTEPTDDGQDVKFTKIKQLTHKDMHESATDLMEIGYSGFPAVLMRADLLRKAGPKLFTPFVDERCEHGVSGEDVAFFARCAIRAGARYAVDRRVKVPHYKRRAIEPVPTAEQVQEAQRLTAQLAATY